MSIPSKISLALSLLTIANSSVFAAGITESGRAVNEAIQSSGHASGSAAHSIAASGQVTSAVSAIPLSLSGAVLGSAGAVSAGAARDLMRAATTPIGTPLLITDETITVIPPNEALKAKANSTNL